MVTNFDKISLIRLRQNDFARASYWFIHIPKFPFPLYPSLRFPSILDPAVGKTLEISVDILQFTLRSYFLWDTRFVCHLVVFLVS